MWHFDNDNSSHNYCIGKMFFQNSSSKSVNFYSLAMSKKVYLSYQCIINSEFLENKNSISQSLHMHIHIYTIPQKIVVANRIDSIT